MYKTLFLSLLFAVFSVAANAQAKPRMAPRKTAAKPLTKQVVVNTDTTTATVSLSDTTGWDAANQKGFMDGCIGSSKMGKEKGTAFCACMLEKVMHLYPKAVDAAAMTKEKAMDLSKECFAETRRAGSTWSVAEQAAFIKECSSKTSKNVGAAKVKTYCNCMLGKIEKAYPNPLDAEKMTQIELDAWAKECGGQ